LFTSNRSINLDICKIGFDSLIISRCHASSSVALSVAVLYWVSGHFGTRTVRHQETGAEVSGHFGTSFFGAELSHGHFGLVPKCLYALTRIRLRKTSRLYCKIVFIVLFKPLNPEVNIVHVRKTVHVEVVM